MSNARQIAKKQSQIAYRDELARRDKVRQAHYRALSEHKTQKEALIAEAEEAEIITEIEPQVGVISVPIKKPQKQIVKRKTAKPKRKAKPARKIMPSVALKESDIEPVYFTVMRTRGWYDVVGPDGPVTIKAVRLLVAEEQAERMNNGLDS